MSCYLENVKRSIFRNLRHQMKNGNKEKFLNQVINYCEKLLADPEEPKIKRVRVKNGGKYVTR
jgi:hypothetical protein